MDKAANNILLRGLSGRLGEILRDWNTRRAAKQDLSSHKLGQVNLPVIRRVEQREERILVQGGDHVRVTRVRLTLLDAAGEVLQKGEALRKEGDYWEFTCKCSGQIMIVEAWDLPGHVTKLVL